MKIVRPIIEVTGFIAVVVLIGAFANSVQDPVGGAIAQVLFLLWYLYVLKIF